MIIRWVVLLSICSGLLGCATPAPQAVQARDVVMATERAFAHTMADRNHAAFASFIAEDAVFFEGVKPLRGKAAVLAAWARFYAKPTAPFSWEPDEVEVLDSGDLALSSGQVRNADGKLIARFNSIWRRTPANAWQIVFDKGSEVCDCKSH